MHDLAAMRFGIEAEFALVHPDRGFCDFSNLSYGEAQRVVDRLPDLGDRDLTRGDIALKVTRWYVEGDERFGPDGAFLRCVPKGLETRTPVRAGIAAAVEQLREQTAALAASAAQDGYRLTSIGRNPYRDYTPEPAYNGWELAMRARHPEYAGPQAYMVGYGPDLNLSRPGWSPRRVLDVGRKLTALSPALIPFSFSSPFTAGRVQGLSMRTLIRAPLRPSARVFLEAGGNAAPAYRARIPAEVGRIEFKAFDALPDPGLYPPLLALLAGLALDPTLPARADRPDAAAHERAARLGFDDPQIRATAARALDAAHAALRGAPEQAMMTPLRAMLEARRTPAHAMIESFRRTGTIPLP